MSSILKARWVSQYNILHSFPQHFKCIPSVLMSSRGLPNCHCCFEMDCFIWICCWLLKSTFESYHEIMALFVLCKLILQTRMHSHPVGLDVWFLVGPFFYFHSSWERTVKTLARLRRCAGSSESSLVAYVITDKYHNLMSWLISILWSE